MHGTAKLRPRDYLEAARCPRSLEPQEFGLWKIERIEFPANTVERFITGFDSQTVLSRFTGATLHQSRGEIVLEDGRIELRKHLPIWLRARGRVLVTGLGLGCVVRGLLANPDVDLVDVVEIDRDIVRVVGEEFAGEPRVQVHCGDALTIPLAGPWDYAWHDLWIEDHGLQVLHARLLQRFKKRCGPQGAWAFPRFMKRRLARSSFQLLG